MVLSNYAKQKILELKIILKTSKRKICNEKKVFLVFCFCSDELGAGSADFSFNYKSNDGTVNISGVLNTASNGNVHCRSLAVIFLVLKMVLLLVVLYWVE